jgi:hypothetical protein
VTRLLPRAGEGLRVGVSSANAESVKAAVVELFDDEDDRAVLVRALLDRSDRNRAIATLNEHLGQVERALEVGRAVPRAIGRAALASGTFAAVVEFGGSVSSARGAAWAPAIAEFLAGAVGTALTLELDRRSAAQAHRVREAWDKIAAVFARRLGDDGPGGHSEGFQPGGRRSGPSRTRPRGSNGARKP